MVFPWFEHQPTVEPARLEQNLQSVPANTMLGLVPGSQKDPPAAEAQYQKTLAVHSYAAVAANNVAWTCVASNRERDVTRPRSRP